MGEHIRKNKAEAGMGGAFIHALPVNSDTFDNVGTVFRPDVDGSSSFFSPLSQSPLEISHSPSRNEALPCLAGELLGFHVLGLLPSSHYGLYAQQRAT